jgi:dTDP-4-amino-4,6-dideoxygalactose transaminase
LDAEENVTAGPEPALESRWRVPLADIAIDDRLREAVTETFESGWWSMGPRVIDFEERFAAFAGSRHAIAVSSGTAALHLALLAVGCSAGDEVVVPSLNFVAAANSIVHTGADPVFCDVAGLLEPNLSVDDFEAAIGPSTKAVVVLHFGGTPCDIDRIVALAGEREIAVIEDAAHAPGAFHNGRMCGTFGQIGCFSFFSNKNLPTGEGGMLVTDDDELAARLRLLRSHGMTTLTWDRHAGHAHSYDVLLPGFNYRIDELRATIGIVQLERLMEENAGRRAIAARYRDELTGRLGLQIPFTSTDEAESSHHLALVLLPESVDRTRVRATLAERGVQSSVHYPPIHRFTAYANLRRPRPLPQTEGLAERILTLPLFAHMTDDQFDIVVESLLAAVSA